MVMVMRPQVTISRSMDESIPRDGMVASSGDKTTNVSLRCVSNTHARICKVV